jgi:uncharacterized membrane protein YdjX (TVP38/TMEM64 family)
MMSPRYAGNGFVSLLDLVGVALVCFSYDNQNRCEENDGGILGATTRRAFAGFLLLAAIIVPFLLWGEKLEALTPEMIDAKIARPLLGGIIALILASDIVLPIPSSIVAFLSGQLLGFIPGAMANFAGLTLGCVAGYALGWFGGRPLASVICGEKDVIRLEAAFARWGKYSILLLRGVPVLAEASIILAGVARLGFLRSMWLAAAPNFCLSLLFAYAGADGWKTVSGVLLFVASAALPILFYLLARPRTPFGG